MFKRLQNDRGYALFLTMLIIIVFGVLSVMLLTVVVSGANKNVVREQVTQASELSEKGIEHITNQIQKDLEGLLGQTGIARSLFESKLLEILNQYKCDKGGLQSNNNTTGNYEVCIEHIESVIDESGNVNDLRKLVTFRSVGNANNKTKTLKTKIEFGSNSVPEVLKYAVSTNIKSPNPKNGEGNLLLHGGVDIHGDVKVEGNLVTYKKGVGAYNWIPSTQPRMYGAEPGLKPRLVLGKNMYSLVKDPYSKNSSTSTNEKNHTAYLNNDNFSSNNYSLKSDPAQLFDGDYFPIIVQRNPINDNIDVQKYKKNYYFNQNTPGVSLVKLSSDATFNGYHTSMDKVVPYTESCPWFSNCYRNYNIKTTFKNTNTFNSLVLQNSTTFRTGNHTFKNGLYVGGNLEIGNLKINNDQDKNRDVITIDGTMYVDGNVTINGVNLTSNAMMYVDGNVDIRFSSIQGKKLSNNQTGTLIIFATGDIYLANNSVYQDNPTHIKGYFYSGNNIEIYGVGSNIHIDGGLAANRVVLNALRGKVDDSYFSGSSYYSGVGYVESESSQKNKNSRLTVKYDTELIENFLKLNPPEPVIYKVDPPKLISRE